VDRAFLEELGLTVREAEDGVVEADLELNSGQCVNPLTRKFINRATFTVLGERLIVVDPPELLGAPPVHLAHLTRGSALEDLLVKTLNDSIFQLQRRSAELSALGISPNVDPTSLQLSAELTAGDYLFTIGTDRVGNFRVVRALRGEADLTVSSVESFELSEFRERAALENWLLALFGETPLRPPPSAASVPEGMEGKVNYGLLVEAFGKLAQVPPRTSIEVMVELKIKGEPFRFAAARIEGTLFRGLLAGTHGKVWAERFELRDFPGVKNLVSKVMGVGVDVVEVLP
jgi:hypothetical protein